MQRSRGRNPGLPWCVVPSKFRPQLNTPRIGTPERRSASRPSLRALRAAATKKIRSHLRSLVGICGHRTPESAVLPPLKLLGIEIDRHRESAMAYEPMLCLLVGVPIAEPRSAIAGHSQRLVFRDSILKDLQYLGHDPTDSRRQELQRRLFEEKVVNAIFSHMLRNAASCSQRRCSQGQLSPVDKPDPSCGRCRSTPDIRQG